MQIKNNTQLNLVIGSPLQHSQSPLLHNTVYQHMGMNAVMRAKADPDLKKLAQAIKALSVELTAVTMPFKEQVLEYLDDYSPEVKELKTANTIIQRDGRLYGHNTDIAGIHFVFANIELRDKTSLVIGAGGAARAMGHFLKINHAKIIWMNRDPRKAERLAQEFGGEVMLAGAPLDSDLDVIINATPVGLYPEVGSSPLPQYIFNEKQIVLDMVYNPVRTSLLKEAEKNQARALSGLDMFVGQGLKQIELWSGFSLEDLPFIHKLKQLLIKNQGVSSL